MVICYTFEYSHIPSGGGGGRGRREGKWVGVTSLLEVVVGGGGSCAFEASSVSIGLSRG